MPNYFEDSDFQDLLAALVVKDRQFLRDSQQFLHPKDFKPRASQKEPFGYARYIIVQASLAYWQKWREPVGKLLRTEVSDFCKQHHLAKSEAVDELCAKLRRTSTAAVGAITDKLIAYRQQVAKAKAIAELVELQSNGGVSDDKWAEICRSGVSLFSRNVYQSGNYFAELQQRVDRRRLKGENRFPAFFIDPLDRRVRSISRGHVGLLMAPYKGGKSLGLIHLSVAHCIQRYKVLYFTLEDPKEDVEDRFDAQITQLPIKKLTERRGRLKERFKLFKSRVRGRIRIIDATGEGLTIPMIESIWEDHRNQGFTADVVIIDYDDELKSTQKRDDRRFEFADIYRDLRSFAGRKNLIVWTGAQTKRGTKGLKIIQGDDLAEDVSKVRKVSMAIGIGRGDWGDDSYYLHVAAHKLDREGIGCNIMPNRDRMMFYDRTKTLQYEKRPPVPADDSDLDL